jgi:hypothetical protein
MDCEITVAGGKYPNVASWLELLNDLEFPPPKWMNFDALEDDIPFNLEYAQDTMNRTKKGKLSFWGEDMEIYNFLSWKDSKASGLVMNLNPDLYKGDKWGLQLIRQLTSTISEFTHADFDVSSFYRQDFHSELPYPSGAFGDLGWLHLAKPLAYEPFFTRDDLLNAPAHEVLEWDDGTIQIMTYKDFLPYNRPEALEAIRRLSLYLNEKRLDGPRMVPELAS